MKHFYIFTFIIILCCLSGCSFSPKIEEEEEITINLPAWPPNDSFSEKYPELSRWEISISGINFQDSFYTKDKITRIRVKKNSPFSLTAQPLTLLENGKECAYFKPAGFIYPWSSEKANDAKWEEGFLANIMSLFFRDAKESCMKGKDTAWIASTFNWKKAQETIDKKINESKEIAEDPENKFYNPWLIPASPILENISVSQFKASLLNMTACYAVSTQTIESKILTEEASVDLQEQPLLSSFIPENSCLAQKKQFTVKKGEQILISSGKKYGILITFQSSKKLSLAFIFLPIYIEDI